MRNSVPPCPCTSDWARLTGSETASLKTTMYWPGTTCVLPVRVMSRDGVGPGCTGFGPSWHAAARQATASSAERANCFIWLASLDRVQRLQVASSVPARSGPAGEGVWGQGVGPRATLWRAGIRGNPRRLCCGWIDGQMGPIDAAPAGKRTRGNAPTRNRTENLLIKSQLARGTTGTEVALPGTTTRADGLLSTAHFPLDLS